MNAEAKHGYKQTALGIIPSDWEVRTVFDIADRQKSLFDDGDWIESEHIRKDGIRLVQTGNIGVGVFIEKESKKYIGREAFDKLLCKEVFEGDILICRLAEPAGRACILPGIGETKVITSVDVTIYRPRDELAVREYLNQYFTSRQWFDSVLINVGGTTHKRISRSALGRIHVPFPPLNEQSEIASALSSADALISSLDQLIAKKRNIQQAAMQQLLTGKRRLPGFSGEWKIKRLGDVADLYQPVTISARQFTDSGYPVYGANGVVGFFSDFNHDSAQVTVTCRGSTCGTVNRTVEKSWITGNAMVINCGQSRSVNKDFLYFQLLGQDLSVCITGTGQPQIVRGPLANFELPIPSDLEEQRAIATILSDMDTELAALDARREKARQLKQGMMQELMTGKVRLVDQPLSFNTISPRFLHGLPSTPYFSSLFKCEINKLLESGGSAEKIMTEVLEIERSVSTSKTKEADRFTHEPLKGLRKKHYFTAEFLTKNLENSWRSAAANKKLTTAIANTLATNPDDPETVASELAQLVVGDTYRDKADASRLTGEWIVYGEKDGIRHYLGLARHDEGDEVIYARLVAGCGQELVDSLKCVSGMQ